VSIYLAVKYNVVKLRKAQNHYADRGKPSSNNVDLLNNVTSGPKFGALRGALSGPPAGC
jgi:hypothetical protein